VKEKWGWDAVVEESVEDDGRKGQQ